jgi:hemerythrin superfamily protein
MDATALLRNDHQAVDRLFTQFAETSPDDPAYRRLIFRLIKSELEEHSRVEEEVFYPAVMRLRSHPARETVRAALEEHQALDGLLAEIDQMEPDDPQYGARLAALRQSVDRHVLAEEGALFAEARIHLTDERLEALGRQMEQSRKERAAASSAAGELEVVGVPAGAGRPASAGPGAAGPGRTPVRAR